MHFKHVQFPIQLAWHQEIATGGKQAPNSITDPIEKCLVTWCLRLNVQVVAALWEGVGGGSGGGGGGDHSSFAVDAAEVFGSRRVLLPGRRGFNQLLLGLEATGGVGAVGHVVTLWTNVRLIGREATVQGNKSHKHGKSNTRRNEGSPFD